MSSSLLRVKVRVRVRARLMARGQGHVVVIVERVRVSTHYWREGAATYHKWTEGYN